MNINLEWYKVFYFVGKFQSITETAKYLCISQPAVSQSVKQLESQMGVKLFKRTAKGMRMTVEGETLYSYVAKGYETISKGEQEIKKMLNMDMGEIKIGASDMTLQFYLLPYLEQFHEKYPDIKIIVTNAPTPETLQFLEEGKIDFGIVTTPFEIGAQLDVTVVREIENVFVAGNKFFALKDQVLSYDTLEEYPLICLERNTSTRKFMDDYLDEKNVVPEPEFELATSDMVVQFACRNLGIGCIMKEFAKKQIEEGNLFPLVFEEEMPKRHICIVDSNKGLMSAAAKRLLELMI